MGGQAVIIQQVCREETTDGIFLKYTWVPKGDHVHDLYDALVDLELPEHPVSTNSLQMNQGNNEDDIQEEYGKMENEKFYEENTKTLRNQDSPIPSRNQDSPIPSQNQDSPIPSRFTHTINKSIFTHTINHSIFTHTHAKEENQISKE